MSSMDLITSNLWIDNNNVLIETDMKLMKDDASDFTSKLLEVASTELREEENTRRQCLKQLKDWIKQNNDIENCILEDRFLLRFLRMKKYSILMTQQLLLKYLNYRKRFKHYMHDMDYLDDKVNEIITRGYIFASPFRDANGRRVIIYNLSKFDPHKYTNVEMARAHAITYETILDDEENQILGVNHVGNLAGISPAIVTLWSITEFATIIRWGEQSFPMRHKEVNLLNLPTGLKYVYDFAISNVSQKMKDRFKVHNSLTDLHKRVSKHCFPLEMGGVMPMNDMIELWKEELAAKREVLLSFDAMNLLNDSGIIRRSNKSVHDDISNGNLPGSFRKLEVD